MTHQPAPPVRLITIALLVVAALAIAVPASAALSSEGFESCLLDRINTARTAAGLDTVEMANDLTDEVAEYSATMSNANTLEHMTTSERYAILPSDWTIWTENVAYHSISNFSDCSTINSMFMNSAGHKANRMNAKVDFAAIGVDISSNGTWVTELFFSSPSYTPEPEVFEGTFSDDEGSVFQADIEALVASGITKGCGENKFCPESTVTRGQMAAFLARALGLPSAPSAGFSDTNGHLFENDINALAAAGVTAGCGSGIFCPDAALTRAHMAAFLERALDLPAAGNQGFVDIAGSGFDKQINALAAAGITKGCNPPANTKFCPSGKVTRGQMAAFLARALDL